MKRLNLVFIALFCMASFDCATISRGTTQGIRFNSMPSGARIIVNDEDMGSTPTTITLKRSREYRVVIKKENYEDVTLNITREFKKGAAIWGNIFSWGVIGMVVDNANGSAYQLSPEELNATLENSGMSLIDNNDPDSIVVYLFTKEDLKK